jgi:hypothetical protein
VTQGRAERKASEKTRASKLEGGFRQRGTKQSRAECADGAKIGDSPLCPRGDEGEPVFPNTHRALGQSRQSPIFAGWHNRLAQIFI